MGNLSQEVIKPGEVEKAEFNFEPIPAGKYKFLVSKCEIREKKDGSGQYVSAEFEVATGEYVGRKVFCVFSIWSVNATAKKVSKYQLSLLAKACGLQQMNDTSEVVDKAVVATIELRKEKKDGALTGNLVNSIKDFEACTPGAQAQKPAPVQQQAPATPETDEDAPF